MTATSLWGVTGNLKKRYTGRFMGDKDIRKFAEGSRAEMLAMERYLVETQPGPLNRELWAGRLR